MKKLLLIAILASALALVTAGSAAADVSGSAAVSEGSHGPGSLECPLKNAAYY